MRLDILLTQQHQHITRNKAEQLIKAHRVKVNGLIVSKPSANFSEDQNIEIMDDVIYVSRSAEKLKLFLDPLNINIQDFCCIDAGASTGGFTQILLEHNVKKVYSVDVGVGQLHSTVSSNERVVSVEQCDIRDFQCDEAVDIVVCDLSFISVSIVLTKLIQLTSKYLLILFKPQFEVGISAKRDSKGVVRDVKAIENAMRNFETFTFSHNLKLITKNKSLIKGKNGNEEFFYLFEK